jgi:hypothetical protein
MGHPVVCLVRANAKDKYRDLSAARQTVRLFVASVEMTWCLDHVVLLGDVVFSFWSRVRGFAVVDALVLWSTPW